MKTKIRVISTIVSAVFFVHSISYSQELETVGAGVIDFLLTNPKTASQTNATEAAALGVIRNLLSISGHRKHQMNLANAVRSEIIINTTGGSHATMYSDNEGNIYLLFNEKIYPISTGLVNLAKGEAAGAKIKNSTLPNYNLTELRKEYQFEKKNKLVEYFLQQSRETIEEIASKNNVSVYDIYIKRVHLKFNASGLRIIGLTFGEMVSKKPVATKGKAYRKLFENGSSTTLNKPPKSHMKQNNSIQNKCYECKEYRGYTISGSSSHSKSKHRIYLNKNIYKQEIVTTFTCNWAKDFDGKGLSFDDFQGVKRSFYENEKLLFILGYTSETAGTWSLEIYEASTGNVAYKKNGTADKGGQVVTVEKDGEKLKPGVYMYNFTLMPDGKDNILKSEKFEIILAGEK